MTQKKGMLGGVEIPLKMLLLAAFMLAMFGCVGGDKLPSAPPGVDLGPLPDNPGPAHSVATLTITPIQGSETYLRSDPAKVVNVGAPPGPIVATVSGGYEWAMYEFDPVGDPLTNLMLDYTALSGVGVSWLAVSNFGTGHWKWFLLPDSGPYNLSLTGGAWTSATGKMYFVMLMHTGGVLEMRHSEVTVDKP
jgi:hypothetical protein